MPSPGIPETREFKRLLARAMEPPEPLEKTDPVLAEHIRRIVAGDHPVRGFQSSVDGLVLYLRSGQRIVRRTERNDPCPCGSGKKYKKCHGQ